MGDFHSVFMEKSQAGQYWQHNIKDLNFKIGSYKGKHCTHKLTDNCIKYIDIYVNLPAVYPQKNVVRCHPHLFQVTRPKSAVLETSKFVFLASLLSHNLCSNDNL